MIDFLKQTLWSQFGAALDSLESAIAACPEHVWGDRSLKPELWYTVYHTLFWLDYYLSGKPDGFEPPAPYNRDEMDPRGLLPDRVYTQAEMLAYLEHSRSKTRARIVALTEETMQAQWHWKKPEFTVLTYLLYTMRHVQHHAAQLNTLLRQTTGDAPRWVSQARTELA